MHFTKMTGNGNDFIVIDDRDNKFLGIEDKISKKLCDRHFSIGADGVLFVRKSNIAQIKMVIINADGSYASMCGNGIRCFSKYVYEIGISKNNPLNIETGDGIKKAFFDIEDNKAKFININMGKPDFNPKKISSEEKEIINKKVIINDKKYIINSIFMGVPHTVVFGNLQNFDIKEGALIEKLNIFNEGTNVNFCEIESRDKIKVKTWERGAGETLACGTGCCASLVVASTLGYINKKAQVISPGGELFIEIKDEGIFMKGPAKVCFEGEINL